MDRCSRCMFNNKWLEMVLLTIYVVECKSLILDFFVCLAMLLHCGFVVLEVGVRLGLYHATCADCRCAALACCCCLDCLF